MNDPKIKIFQRILRHCLTKGHDLERTLYSGHPIVVQEKKHLEEGLERGYWIAGYLKALKDIQKFAETGEPVHEFEEDGGPKRPLIASKLIP